MTEQDNDLWLKLIAAMHQRRDKGYITYGKPLTIDDIRNFCKETREELLDGSIYLLAAEEKMDAMEMRIIELEDKMAAAKDEITLLKSQLKSATEGR